ncbi:MAG: sigma-70 family RNA polymerase sigma factor [Deltaproteobacteria bacterium]|nr:sigma-70 family RNA polymerase sigma factor [Deltaproteobacteria bacterium]
MVQFDAKALERLFVEHEQPLFNVVLRWTWNREDAAEIVQEAFGRLWAMAGRVDPPRAQALVYRIALNLAASRRRWHKVRTFVGIAEERPDPTANPDEDLLRRERHQTVARAIEALPESQRRALVLCEMTELSYAQIAAILRTRPGTVGSRRHAALLTLRRTLADEQDNDHVTI